MERKLRLSLYAKMLIGFIISFTIAHLLKLPYSYTAGVIAILHAWYSRDNVVKTAITRLLASFVGLALSALLFFAFGYTIQNLFFMVFAVLAVIYLLKLESGATIALVLIGQQWGEQTAWAPLNALFIMLIGTIPALLLNLFTFRKSQLLEIQQSKLDTEIALIFKHIATNEPYDFSDVNKVLTDTRASLQVALDNYKVENITKALRYINVRSEQISILQRIVKTLEELPTSSYKSAIVDYLALFQERIGVNDYATELQTKRNELLDYYRQLELPKTRDEFEHRALLFTILQDIKQFLDVKIEFHKAFPTT